MQAKQITIRHFVFSKFYHYLLIPFLALVFDQLNMINNPDRSPVIAMQKTGILHYLSYFFLQLYVFELITFAILAILIRLYLRWFKMATVQLGLKPILFFQLKLLPLFLFSILVFGPVTNLFRYLLLVYPSHGWALYFPAFFLTPHMYFNYLVPVLIWGYLLINIDMVLSYIKRPQNLPVNKPVDNLTGNFISVIEVSEAKGSTIMPVSKILWFEVDQKNYYAHDTATAYSIKKTLSELEEELSPEQFFRINRSQIINFSYIKSYSYWEFEKYVIRLVDIPHDFVITRKRFKELKSALGNAKSLS